VLFYFDHLSVSVHSDGELVEVVPLFIFNQMKRFGIHVAILIAKILIAF
jgi:hypothetical protein